MPTKWEAAFGVALQLGSCAYAVHSWGWHAGVFSLLASTWIALNVRVYCRGRKP